MFTVIMALINVAFLTLLERKILGLSQTRKGPNKVSFAGILQPIADAVKLFLKEHLVPFKANKLLFYLRPIIGLGLALSLWWAIPLREFPVRFLISRILFITILGFGAYPIIFMGWSSNRKYASLGALRGVAQTISYEIRLALLVLIALVIRMRLKLEKVSSIGIKI